MKRKIINIDRELCNGCGLCIPDCPEGAIQMVDGKATLVSEPLCDGLGACLGKCPEGAITIEERDSEPYDERIVMENMIEQGEDAVKYHLNHLKEHNEEEYLKTALEVLKEKNMNVPDSGQKKPATVGGCPGSVSRSIKRQETGGNTVDIPSALTHWPIQLHLISPGAPHFAGSDVLISADCVAYTLGNFHSNYLKGKTLTIACPKLDDGQDIYMEKITQLIDGAKVNTITVMIMEVPCCTGLLRMVQRAADKAARKVPVKAAVVGISGKIIKEEWV